MCVCVRVCVCACARARVCVRRRWGTSQRWAVSKCTAPQPEEGWPGTCRRHARARGDAAHFVGKIAIEVLHVLREREAARDAAVTWYVRIAVTWGRSGGSGAGLGVGSRHALELRVGLGTVPLEEVAVKSVAVVVALPRQAPPSQAC